MRFLQFVLTGILLLQLCYVGAQKPVAPGIKPSPVDRDSIPESPSREIPDRQPASAVDFSTLKISPDQLDSKVDYDAQDSMYYDIINEKMHLYGGAVVKYTDLSLEAGYIIIDWSTNIITASSSVDSLGKPTGFPSFSDGDQNFEAKKMRYNFKSGKGKIYDIRSKQNDLFVLGREAKIISKDADTTRTDDVVYSSGALITTCDHPQPHYGIRSRRQKVIPNKMAIVGPSNLEIAGVPTPLWLPFGFFPITQTRRSGLIFPRDYEFSEEWGFGLRDLGYYIPINDYMDLRFTGMIYLRGTWGLTAASSYRKRYKFNGNVNISFSDRKREVGAEILSDKSYAIRWSHSQDAKAHPTRKLSVNINLQTNDYQSLNNNDANSVLQNQLSSNATFTQLFPGKPFRLTANFSHSQNTLSRDVKVSFPVVDFQMNRIYPFKRKTPGAKEKWYEKVSFKYDANLQNQFNAKDTTLFSSQTLEDARFGIRHRVSSDASFNVFKYFRLAPNISYEEDWYFKTLQKQFDPALEITYDTLYNPLDTSQFEVTADTTFGRVNESDVYGFEPLRLFNAGISLNTEVFGTMRFKKGLLRGIRHVIKPSFGFSYTPDYTSSFWDYFREVDTDTRPEYNDPMTYNIFQNGIYSKPSSSGLQMLFNYRINNIFEGKYFSKRDTTEKKFKIFDNVVLNGNYNFAADSLKFSLVTVSGTTRLLKGLTTFNFNLSYDPYAADERGTRINTLLWKKEGKLLRFVSASYRFSTRISVKRLRDMFASKEKQDGDGDTKKKKEDSRPSFTSLFDNFTLNHNFVVSRTTTGGVDTTFISTHSINTSGNIDLTRNWKLRFGNIGYDFRSKRITYPDVGFFRELHCWEMGMNWQPQRGTYSFYIRVKPSSLGFLNIPYQKNNADAFGGF